MGGGDPKNKVSVLLVQSGKMVLSVYLRRSLSGARETSMCIRTQEVSAFEDKHALGMWSIHS